MKCFHLIQYFCENLPISLLLMNGKSEAIAPGSLMYNINVQNVHCFKPNNEWIKTLI